MLLVFPPVAKPCEPPSGIAKLAAALRSRGIACDVLDANLEGLLHLVQVPVQASDTWTRRAQKNLPRNLAALRDAATYRSLDRYSRAVNDLERLLAVTGSVSGARVGLANYEHKAWSPLRSADLLAAAERPEQDPFFPYFSKRLAERIEETGTRVVGFSLNYLNQALCTFAMIGHVRRRYPEMRIVIGGGLVTSWMRQAGWREPFRGLVDHCFAGPGEGPLLELHGVCGPPSGPDIPDYRALPLPAYLSPGLVLPYSGSSGCSWRRCSFCPEAAEENPYAPVPVPQALAEVRALAKEHQPALLHLLDNAVSPALLLALAADPPGAPWYGFARIGPELADLDHCRALKRSGCVMIKLGLESGDQDVLDAMRKGVDLATASKVLGNLRKAGIAAYVYLLFGTPAETEGSARRTLAFTVRHADAIGFLNLAVFNMPRCAREAQQYGTGHFYEGDLSLYTDFRHPGGWDRKRVRLFLEREFRRHGAVAAILRRDPPVFTSNHAAFFPAL